MQGFYPAVDLCLHFTVVGLFQMSPQQRPSFTARHALPLRYQKLQLLHLSLNLDEDIGKRTILLYRLHSFPSILYFTSPTQVDYSPDNLPLVLSSYAFALRLALSHSPLPSSVHKATLYYHTTARPTATNEDPANNPVVRARISRYTVDLQGHHRTRDTGWRRPRGCCCSVRAKLVCVNLYFELQRTA